MLRNAHGGGTEIVRVKCQVFAAYRATPMHANDCLLHFTLQC